MSHVIGPKGLGKNLSAFQKNEKTSLNGIDIFDEPSNKTLSFNNAKIIEKNLPKIKEKEVNKNQKSINKANEQRRDSFGNIIQKGNKNHKIAFDSKELVITVSNLKQFNKKNTIKNSKCCLIF